MNQFQAALLQRWNLPEIMCPFCPFVQYVSVNVSVFTLVRLIFVRAFAIHFNIKFYFVQIIDCDCRRQTSSDIESLEVSNYIVLIANLQVTV